MNKDTNQVTLEIDGKEVKAKEGMTVLEVAKGAGIDIPTLCYHEALSPYGACRLCTVEITSRGRSRLLTACTYPVEEGLVVQTDTVRVHRARRMIVELLLARCPDVKIIQDLADEYGIEKPRFKIEDDNCILCGLCVRICEERMGVSAINFVGRGIDREVDTPFHMHSDVCVTCGACAFVCPTGAIKLEDITKNKPLPIPCEFDEGLKPRSPIHVPYPQAVPNLPVIDRKNCIHYLTGECEICQEFCQAGAIKYDQEDEVIDIDVGAIILAPGFDEFEADLKGEYGYGKFPNVITSIEFERILSASGPFQGKIQRPSDGREPHRIGFVQCVGSRDTSCGNEYCSSVCCTYAVKEAIIAKEHATETEPTIFFMDMRTYGKGFEEFYNRAKDEYGVRFIRSRVSSVEEMKESQNLRIKYETEEGEFLEEEFDLVVLSVGLTPSEGAKELAERLGIELNEYGFCRTDPSSPLATSRPGISVCGTFQGPKDIPETVMQASGAVACASGLLSSVRGTMIEKKEYPEEIEVSRQEPKIGAFICHCGINIGGYLRVPEVVEYVKTLPYVVYAEDNLYTCSQDTQERIKEKIKEHNLNRVFVASCSPRTHEPLFQETIREAGLNPYLFEMANIRDQCSWVHMHEPEAATEKAKKLVGMGIAKCSLLEPLKKLHLDVNHKGLVIGGGLAGMTAALALAESGFEVYLIEKEDELGGNLRDIHYTLEGDGVQDYLNSLIYRVNSNELIHAYTNVEIKDIEGYVGNFKTIVKTMDSGQGLEPKTDLELEHGVIIVATGAEEYETDQYLYGEDERVVTQRELESRISAFESNFSSLDTVVMIQCVGSRDEERPYCSRYCCGEAIKNARKLKKRNSNLNIFILYRDMRTYGFKESHYKQAREEGVVFIRYEADDKPQVTNSDDGLKVTVKDPLLNEQLRIDADLLVLSTATVAPEGNKELAQMLKVPLSDDGFFLEAHVKLRPVDFATDGIFVCGLAHSPKFIEETIAQASAAASRACTILAKDKIETEGIVASINKDTCKGCQGCVGVCPYNAITFLEDERVCEVNEALCKGCGACAATCPSGSAKLRGFVDYQLYAQIERAFA